MEKTADIIDMVKVRNIWMEKNEANKKFPRNYAEYMERFLLPKMESDVGKNLVQSVIDGLRK